MNIFASHSSGVLNLGANGTSDRMTINSTGVGLNRTPTGSLDIHATDGLNLRFYNDANTFRAGLELATTNGDMIGTSEVNDFVSFAR